MVKPFFLEIKLGLFQNPPLIQRYLNLAVELDHLLYLIHS